MSAGSHSQDAQGTDPERPEHVAPWDRAAIIAIAVGVAARAVVLVLHPPVDFVYSDMAGYVTRAQHLATGGPQGRLDAFFPSGTHVVLAIPLFIFGSGRSGLWAASILWFVLGSLSPWLAWRWARRILPVQAAALTASFISLWPLFITQVGFFLSEVPALTFLLGALLLAARFRDDDAPPAVPMLAAFGLVVGTGFAVRPQLALNDAVAVLPVVLTLWKQGVGRRVALLAALLLGLIVPVGVVATLNTDAANHPVLISENTGVNFFLAQCDGGAVYVYGPHTNYRLVSPVYVQDHKGRLYVFKDHDIWDQGFFVGQAFDCVRSDGVRHLRVIGRHILDLTVTSVPWPQVDDPGMRGVVRATNVGYSVLLPTVLVASGFVFWRRRPENRGPRLVLAHLLCVLPTVIFFVSEPRYRIPYDAFGLALVAALAARALAARRGARTPEPGKRRSRRAVGNGSAR